MKYGKLENNRIIYAKLPLKINGKDVFTTDAEIFLSQGYKEIVNTTPEQREGYYPVGRWEETELQIIREWDYYPESYEPTDEERLEAQVLYTALMTDTLLDEEEN